MAAGRPGVFGGAVARGAFDAAAAPRAARLLGGLLLVEDAAAAYRLARDWPPGYAAVAPDGVVVHSGGLGELPGGAANDVLARESRRREATAALEQLRAALAARETSAAEQAAAIDALQESVDGRAQEDRRLSVLEAEAAARLAQARQEGGRGRPQRDCAARPRAPHGAAARPRAGPPAQTQTAPVP